MAPHALRRIGATAAIAMTGLTAAATATSAAPIANSCGGVVTAGETTTIHDTYTVVKGDTLYRIVRDIDAAGATTPPSNREVARQVALLRRANRGTVRNRGNLIFPGQVLRLPETLRYCTKA